VAGRRAWRWPAGWPELFAHVLAKDYPDLDVRGGTRHARRGRAAGCSETFQPKSGARAERTLRRRGVDVITGVGVDRIERCSVHLADGRHLDAHNHRLGCRSTCQPRLPARLGVPLGRGGRIVVAPDLSVPTHPDVFAIGDISTDADAPLAQVAQPAIQGGHHVACQIVRRLGGQPTKPFHYFDKGSMATIGRHDAVAEFPKVLGVRVRLSGPLGWAAWLGPAHPVPDGLPQPGERVAQLDLELPHLRPAPHASSAPTTSTPDEGAAAADHTS